MKNTRLSEHALRKEGKPYVLDLCGECRRYGEGTWRDEHAARSLNQHGHALCTCGTPSPHLQSDNQRRKWHQTHKIAVLGVG